MTQPAVLPAVVTLPQRVSLCINSGDPLSYRIRYLSVLFRIEKLLGLALAAYAREIEDMLFYTAQRGRPCEI